MRRLTEKVKAGELPQPDLIVSELLGSFGDNELSPECLDGVTDILRPTTVSIPSSYTSYLGIFYFVFCLHLSTLLSILFYFSRGFLLTVTDGFLFFIS